VTWRTDMENAPAQGKFLAWSEQHEEAITVTRFALGARFRHPVPGTIYVINGRHGKWFVARHWQPLEPPQ